MNKVVVVTGGSRGIGKGIALRFAKAGYQVVVNYLGSAQKAKEVQAEIEALGQQCLLVQANVGILSEVNALVAQTIQTFGRIDVLINNSGITKDQLFLRMSEQDFDVVVNTNLKGTFNCCKEVSKIMMKQKFGAIINMSSVIGITGNVGQANYAASKAGVIGLTKSLAKELAHWNIRVNAIAPGFIETEMTAALSEAVREKSLQAISLKRFGQVEEVANVALFLADEQSAYITGQVICVDGGMIG